MSDKPWQAAFQDLLSTLGLQGHAGLPAVNLSGDDPLVASPHRLARAAALAAAAQAAAVACIWHERSGRRQVVEVDARDALNTLNTSAFLRQHDHSIGFGFGHSEPLNSFYEARGGRWFRFVGSRQHHRDAVLRELGCANYNDSIATAVRARDPFELEERCRELGVPGVVARSAEEWRSEDHGRHLGALPVVRIEKIGDSDAQPWREGPRPLSGVRVLEMTHVLAGPACSRTLASHGAQALRVSAPSVPGDPLYMAIDTGFGKRNTFVDIRTAGGLDTLRSLVGGADVFAQSFRHGSLARRGLSPEALAALRPGIVCLDVSCFGDGPWRDRVGFDPNAVTATGVCMAEAPGGMPRLPPTSLMSDYLTGYLGAAGVAAALLRRAREGGSYHVKVSLARSAMWVQDLGLLSPRQYLDKAARLDTSLRGMRTASPFGELTHLPAFPPMSDTPPHWTTPPLPLGECEPNWAVFDR